MLSRELLAKCYIAEDLEDMSVEDKLGRMNALGTHVSFKIEKQYKFLVTDEEYDIILAIADGLSEEYVLSYFEGRCSLARTLESVDKYEKYVDDRIILCIKILERIEKYVSDTEQFQTVLSME
jgi:hypothetical protein